jgi:hypothetical protein
MFEERFQIWYYKRSLSHLRELCEHGMQFQYLVMLERRSIIRIERRTDLYQTGNSAVLSENVPLIHFQCI